MLRYLFKTTFDNRMGIKIVHLMVPLALAKGTLFFNKIKNLRFRFGFR